MQCRTTAGEILCVANSRVIPSDMISVILQHDEIMRMLSVSTTKTFQSLLFFARITSEIISNEKKGS